MRQYITGPPRRQGSEGWILRNRKQRWQHQRAGEVAATMASLPCQKSTVAALHKYAQFMEHLVLLTLDDDISLVLLFRLKKRIGGGGDGGGGGSDCGESWH